MRSALRYLPAGIVAATCVSVFAAIISCGPPELFLGAFHPLSDGASDAPPLAEDASVGDALFSLEDGAPLGDASEATSCPAAFTDAAAAMTNLFQDPSCRGCVMSSCCSTVTACFLEHDDAGVRCELYVRCLVDCRAITVVVDGGGAPDGSGDASVPSCELACSHVAGSTLYSELEACAAATCSCQPF